MFNLKQKNFLIILSVLLLLIVYIDCKIILKREIKKDKFENENVQLYNNNKDDVFKISQIIKYSSADVIDNTTKQNLQNLSIHQYSDMAIYIDNINDEITQKNTVKELYIDNFNIDLQYNYGTPILYYKNPLDISKFRMIDENEIKDVLKYEIINTNKENQENNFEKPTFFADCSNPITIGFVNKDIVKDYKITKENSLVSFDGRILKNLDIDLKNLSPKVSFTIHIKNNLDEEYACDASVKFNLDEDDGTVESGYVIEMQKDINYYKFLRKK